MKQYLLDKRLRSINMLNIIIMNFLQIICKAFRLHALYIPVIYYIPQIQINTFSGWIFEILHVK